MKYELDPEIALYIQKTIIEMCEYYSPEVRIDNDMKCVVVTLHSDVGFYKQDKAIFFTALEMAKFPQVLVDDILTTFEREFTETLDKIKENDINDFTKIKRV